MPPTPPETRIRTAKDLGQLVRTTRKALAMTQGDLAAASGTSVPFIVHLEQGKGTSRLEMSLHVLRMLGIDLVARG